MRKPTTQTTQTTQQPQDDLRLIDLVAFAGGAYSGWALGEGQHTAIRVGAGLLGGMGASALASKLL